MGNYFFDNSDLQFNFENLEITDAVESRLDKSCEDNNSEHYADYIEVYKSSLELCGDIAADFIAPRAAAIDEQGSSFHNGEVSYSNAMEEVKNCLSESGFMGVLLPVEYGGLNFPVTVYCMMIEMVSQADASVMTLFGYQDIGETIAHHADKDIAREILPSYCSGEKIGAMVLTEPGGGTDLQAVKVSATRNSDGGWQLNGTKCFISHGHRDVLLVLARSDDASSGMFGLSLFLVNGGSSNGVQVNRVESKMGLHGSPTCELFFNNSVGHLVGRENLGLSLVVDILNQARFSVAAQAIGIAENAFKAAEEYSHVRTAFGKPLYKIPQIHTKLMNIQALQFANRALLYSGCQWLDLRNAIAHIIEKKKSAELEITKQEKVALRDAQKYVNLLSPLAKLTISENAIRICYESQQVFGGSGYIKGSTVERCARNVRITTIYEGTTEVLAGAALKCIMSGTAQEYIAKVIEKESGINNISKSLIAINSIFQESLSSLKKNDKYYMDAVAIDMVTIYASLYSGCLLLESVKSDTTRTSIVERYLNLQLSECQSCKSRLQSNIYDKPADF